MIEKQCQFSGRDEEVGLFFHLLHPGYDDSIEFVKEAQASAPIIAEVQDFLKNMGKPVGKQHVLLSALGAGEFWGANTNGDFFPEHSLIHTPQQWGELSHKIQKMVGSQWEWGYPTFYNAHAFQHHVNKDPKRAFGDVEYACWDPGMKRVLLVVAIDRGRAKEMGATGVVDKIDNGEFPDVSMGCRVPFDLCSICTDWPRITGNPKKDLAEHRRNSIRGVSVTTKDYCQHLKFEVGRVYPDGKKVWMWNLHPRFFDISFVFIGADKSSKVMAKLAHCPIREDKKKCASCIGDRCSIPSAHVHEVWSREKAASVPITYQAFPEFEDPKDEERINRILKLQRKRMSSIRSGLRKGASSPEERVDDLRQQVHDDQQGAVDDRSDMERIEEAFAAASGKDSALGDLLKTGMMKMADLDLKKKAEIVKRIQSHFNRAMPIVGEDEPDIPNETLDEMSKCPADALSTAGGLGIVLKPREFQRVYVRAIGEPDLADDLDRRGMCFRCGAVKPDDGFRLSHQIVPQILEALRPLMGERSALWPSLNRRRFRVTIAVKAPEGDEHPFLDKVAGAYEAYRRSLVYGVTDLVPRTIHEYPAVLGELVGGDLFPHNHEAGLVKAGGDMVQSLLGMFPAAYINGAYMPGPVSKYVQDHTNFAGLRAASALAASGGAA